MRKRLGLFAILFSICMSFPISSLAFTSNGHDVIEATAYRHILEQTNIEQLSMIAGRTFSGKDALSLLIAYRILDRPHEWGEKNTSNDPLRSLPIVRSGNIDYILSRQFEGNSQCFHFMARASDVYWDTTTDSTYGYPRMLYDSAYPRCVAFLTSVFDLVLNNALAARAGDHDVYGLMHAIGDSYSAAHTARDTNWNILYLKVWEPTAYIPYFFHPDAWKFYDGPWGHKMSDERDDDYWDNAVVDSTCTSSTNPYQVDDDCLSRRGKEAVAAVQALLIVLAENVLREHLYHGVDTAFEHASWKEYLATYFVGWKGVATARHLRPDEREWRPLVHAGLEYHPTSYNNVDVRDFTADINMDAPIAILGPVMPGLVINFGERVYPDHTESQMLRLGYALAFEFADDFELRMIPFEREFILAPGHKGETRNLVSFLQVEGIVERHLWFRAEAPRFSSSGWVPNDYGVAIGYSDGWDIGKWFSERTGTGKPLPVNVEWKVPDGPNTNLEIDSAKLGSGMSVSGTILNLEFNSDEAGERLSLSSFSNNLFGISTQLLWDRNSSGVRNPGLANGLELDYYMGERVAGEAGYILRYYLSPHFAITSEPLDLVKNFNGVDEHPSGALDWDLESNAGIMALLVHTDLTLGLLRISWRDVVAHKSPFYQEVPAGLRIGANFFLP